MLNTPSLREQVYEFLRSQLIEGILKPGSIINVDSMSKELGISKTPLKEAVIKLESEGFVSILARKGILVNQLTRHDIKSMYEIIGSLEANVLVSIFDRLTEEHLEVMHASNREQVAVLEAGDYNRYYHLNLDFHDIFLSLSDNQMLKTLILPMKQRLYDWPRRQYWREWEQVNLDEHRKIMALIEKGDAVGAASVLRDEHWGWSKHEPYFMKFYGFDQAEETEAQTPAAPSSLLMSN